MNEKKTYNNLNSYFFVIIIVYMHFWLEKENLHYSFNGNS